MLQIGMATLGEGSEDGQVKPLCGSVWVRPDGINILGISDPRD